MAQNDQSRTRAKAWDIDAARRRAGFILPAELADRAAWLGRLLSQWAIAEVAPGRLLPWLPVAFGFGIVAYFTADREPAWWAASALALAGVIVAFAARHRAVGFALALGFAAMAAGFATATLRSEHIAHPVLLFPVSSVTLTGFVEIREERERSDRIVVRVQHIEGRRLNEAPDRVRLAVRKNTAPAVGSFVELKAHLSPPLAPLRPGGYDFARDMFFQRIGASGYALGTIKIVAPPVSPGLWLHYAAFIDGIREAIDKRIRAVIPGDEGSIASALITGKRDAISTPVNDAMYISSLAHVLSIVIANLLAMPVVSAEVMPMGILGVLAMPFGFDAVFWKLMGAGIDWMDTVALWVTSLPGAVGHVRAFGTGPLLLGTAAILLLCLLRTPLRWSGAVLAVAASLWAVTTPLPDVLVSGDGQTATIRGGDGRLAVLHSNRDAFAVKEWLAADGDARTVKDASLHDGVQCDAAGCIGRLSDGRLVSEALSAEAFAEDCARAAVVVSPREAPGDCKALLIDRKAWRANGAVALRWTGDRFELSAARPPGYERPWASGLPGSVQPARGSTGRARCHAAAGRYGRG